MFEKKIKIEELNNRVVEIKSVSLRTFKFKFIDKVGYFIAKKPKYFNWNTVEKGDVIRLRLCKTHPKKDFQVLRVIENYSKGLRFRDQLPDLVSIRELQINEDKTYFVMEIEENIIALWRWDEIHYIRRPKGDTWKNVKHNDHIHVYKIPVKDFFVLECKEVE